MPLAAPCCPLLPCAIDAEGTHLAGPEGACALAARCPATPHDGSSAAGAGAVWPGGVSRAAAGAPAEDASRARLAGWVALLALSFRAFRASRAARCLSFTVSLADDLAASMRRSALPSGSEAAGRSCGSVVRRTLSTSAGLAPAIATGVVNPCSYRARATEQSMPSICMRGTSSVRAPNVSLFWKERMSDSIENHFSRLQNTATTCT
mmetsp:Transcript_112309/g.318412  ORF Transcript_112309/g.318412 Transcript_112309/m.318412 type:complete len:207 (+) Transcript_112309:566-1186(+)